MYARRPRFNRRECSAVREQAVPSASNGDQLIGLDERRQGETVGWSGLDWDGDSDDGGGSGGGGGGGDGVAVV